MSRQRRVAVITGGSMGIGETVATAFAEHGDDVVICARNEKTLREAAAEMPGHVIPICCDVADETSVERFVGGVRERFGRIDILVNNAGIYGPIGPSWENDPQEWLKTIQIDLFGVFLMNRHVVPGMIEQGGGVITNLSGGGATAPKPRYSAYAAAKAGLIRYLETLAVEVAEFGIRVNAIAPGFIATRLHQETLEAGSKAGSDLAKVKEKLAGGGDDCRPTAELALFLASDDAKGITGRLFSSIWDDWRSLADDKTSLDSAELYTIRRIDNMFFKEVPRK